MTGRKADSEALLSGLKISDVLIIIEKTAPPPYQESYDNAGLAVGDSSEELKGILLALDCTEAVVDEAISKKCNLIISHHPVIFKGIKKITGTNYTERTILKAIRNNISLYSAHTNLDNISAGVNRKIAEVIGLKNCRILLPKTSLLKKLVTFCPHKEAEKVRSALFSAGAGHIGNYSECSFGSEGTGTFKGSEATNPFAGTKGVRHEEPEIRIEMIFEGIHQQKIVQALLQSHPYEEVAYDIYSLNNSYSHIGSGIIGTLENEMDEKSFLGHLKSAFKTACIRHTAFLNKPVKTVAACGGSGSFLLYHAMGNHADAFITADFKYHQFFDADNNILIADIGHYESEQFTMQLIHDLLKDKIPTFALHFAETVTNPVKYF